MLHKFNALPFLVRVSTAMLIIGLVVGFFAWTGPSFFFLLLVAACWFVLAGVFVEILDDN